MMSPLSASRSGGSHARCSSGGRVHGLVQHSASCCRTAQANPDWHRAIPGFKIAGNLYYVGTADLAVYLIATPQGNILINGDFKQDVPTIRKSIEGLGFKYATRRSS